MFFFSFFSFRAATICFPFDNAFCVSLDITINREKLSSLFSVTIRVNLRNQEGRRGNQKLVLERDATKALTVAFPSAICYATR